MCQFENYVNYAGSKTKSLRTSIEIWFENYVNYAGSKTIKRISDKGLVFENYVNYAGSKTLQFARPSFYRLRTM